MRKIFNIILVIFVVINMTTFSSLSARANPETLIEDSENSQTLEINDTNNSQSIENDNSEILQTLETENIENSQTDETDDSETILNEETSLEVIDEGEVDNQVKTEANTGDNVINENTSTGDVTTGDIEGSTVIVNLENSELAEDSSIGSQSVEYSDECYELIDIVDGRVYLKAFDESEDSDQSFIADRNLIYINNGSVFNDLEVSLNTGGNSIESNTVIGDLETGDIVFSTSLFNFINLIMPEVTLTIDLWSFLDGYGGDIVLGEIDLDTGDFQNVFLSGENANVEIINDADIENLIDIDTNTGDNDIEYNTVVGDISSGDTNTKATVMNLENINDPLGYIYLFNIFGEFTGTISDTLSDIVYINQINQAINTDTPVIIENYAEIMNDVNIVANTGRNTVKCNTVVGDINTGSIDLSTNIINLVNSFSDKIGSLAIRIINIFGNYGGDICYGTCSDGEIDPGDEGEAGNGGGGGGLIPDQVISDDNVEQMPTVYNDGDGYGGGLLSNNSDLESSQTENKNTSPVQPNLFAQNNNLLVPDGKGSGAFFSDYNLNDESISSDIGENIISAINGENSQNYTYLILAGALLALGLAGSVIAKPKA